MACRKPCFLSALGNMLTILLLSSSVNNASKIFNTYLFSMCNSPYYDILIPVHVDVPCGDLLIPPYRIKHFLMSTTLHHKYFCWIYHIPL